MCYSCDSRQRMNSILSPFHIVHDFILGNQLSHIFHTTHRIINLASLVLRQTRIRYTIQVLSLGEFQQARLKEGNKFEGLWHPDKIKEWIWYWVLIQSNQVLMAVQLPAQSRAKPQCSISYHFCLRRTKLFTTTLYGLEAKK